MKKLFVIVGAVALASCGSADTAVDDSAAEDVAAAEVSASVGTYTGAAEDGSAWTSVLNADGTYVDSAGEEVTETGSWTDSEGNVCFTPDIGEGEEAAAEACFGMGEVAEDGSVVVTNADGEEMTMQKSVD